MKSKAFTLAEVLITLAIIGVVAALTIISMVSSWKDLQYKSAYKDAYSSLAQALNKAIAEDTLVEAAGQYDEGHWLNFKTILGNMKLLRTCWDYTVAGESGSVTGGNANCWATGGEGWNPAAGNYPNNSDLAVIDASGRTWSLCARGYNSLYAVDTNGFAKPNQMGKDRFIIVIKDASGSSVTGIPAKVGTDADNNGSVCAVNNKCKTELNYYPTTWLYN